MKNKIILLLALIGFSNLFYAQNNEYGTKFEYDPKSELDAKFVLKDNYNHYLFSAINVDGMLRNHQIILRKFDQKNKLVQTFRQDYGSKDLSVLCNYLGSFEVDNNKIIVITESYSGKLNKKEITKHLFDKTTSTFESTVIATYPIESLSKSGTTYVRKSENNNFIGIDYVAYNSKKDPEQNTITMLDATGKQVWQKTVSLDPGFFTNGFTVTNSATAIVMREARSYKVNSIMTIINAEKQEDKTFDAEIKVQEPKSISIGNKDYLLAFNYPKKGVRSCDFQDLLLYDLENGKILKNNKISAFDSAKDLREVIFKNITLQNNEIIIFAEAKSEIVVKPTPDMVISWDKNYKYEKASLFVMSFDGTLKTEKQLINDQNVYSNLFQSYGLLSVKGNFYVNNGFDNYYKHTNTFCPLDALNNYAKNSSKCLNITSILNQTNHRLVNQLVCHFQDSNRIVFTIMTNENEMCLVNVYGLQ